MPTSVALPVRSVTQMVQASTTTMLSPMTLVLEASHRLRNAGWRRTRSRSLIAGKHYRTGRVACPPAMTDLPIARNTALLSAALAANSGMLQLQAAVASLTLVQVLGIDGLLGLGPAIVLASGALTAPTPAGAMDRVGRVPVLAVGFTIGAVGGVFAAIGCAAEVAVLVLGGFVLVGVASGIAPLARTAAGDMYPPERRAHGIALVLFRAVFGAILGPAVFSPLLHGKHLDGDALAPLGGPAGSGFMLVALVLVLMVRPDPEAHRRDLS